MFILGRMTAGAPRSPRSARVFSYRAWSHFQFVFSSRQAATLSSSSDATSRFSCRGSQLFSLVYVISVWVPTGVSMRCTRLPSSLSVHV